MSSLAARFLPSRKTALGIVALCALGVAGWLSARMGTGTIEELGIGDRAEHYPPELSGGQQQRVAVARALANQPELILADEPTAAPDGQRGRQVMELFRRIAHERGTAAIVVTHDHRALDVFDTIYELEDELIRHGDQPAGVLMRHLRGAPLALALLLCGCPGPGGGAPTPQPTRGAQERPDPRRAQAMEAAKALGEQLKARLGQAIQEGGLGAGIETCKVAAPAIGTKLSGERSLRLGRTSFKLRNPANAVPTWAQAEVDARRETPSFSEGPDGTLRALLPIRMAGLCVACHGPRESLSQEVQEALAKRYPEDRATGFGEGELRGWFWVEVPQE